MSATRRPRSRTAAAIVAAVVIGVSALAGCGSKAPYGAYVALGDSYTAAPGEGPGNVAPCNRSDDNYPHVIAASINATLTDVSCSGATLDDLTSSQATGVAPQLAAVTPTTKLITLGIGGNDLDLTGYAQACATGADCNALTADMITKTTALTQRLIGVVAQIKQKAPLAKIILVGYPLIVGSSCGEAPVPSQYVPLLVRVNTSLDTAISEAATTAGVTYADLLTPSQGHDICGSDPWIAGISGSGAQPLHPKPAEQHAVAGIVEKLV